MTDRLAREQETTRDRQAAATRRPGSYGESVLCLASLSVIAPTDTGSVGSFAGGGILEGVTQRGLCFTKTPHFAGPAKATAYGRGRLLR